MPRMQPGEEQHIHLQAYVEAAFHPDTLDYLWRRLQENKLSRMIWADGKPLPRNDFIRFYTPENGRLLLLPTYQPEGTQSSWQAIMGMIWFDEIYPGHKAFGHFMFFRDWWGGWPLAAIKKVLAFVFGPPLSLKMVVCQMNVDNRFGIALWDRLGIRTVGEIPDWYRHEDGFHSARFGVILASDIAILQQNNVTKESPCEASR